MSDLYVCKEYETPYEEGYRVIRTIEEHNKIIYNQALEDFERKMSFFCFGLRASEGNLCRVDVIEDELQRVKRQLKEKKNDD